MGDEEVLVSVKKDFSGRQITTKTLRGKRPGDGTISRIRIGSRQGHLLQEPTTGGLVVVSPTCSYVKDG